MQNMRRKRDTGPDGPAQLVELAESVVLVGLVSPKGTSGGRWGQEKYWTLNSDFIAWRRVGDELMSTPLHLSRTCDYEVLKQLQAKLPGLSIVRVRARIGLEGRADLVEILDGAVRDEALEALAKSLSEPLERTDPDFGILTFNRMLARCSGAGGGVARVSSFA